MKRNLWMVVFLLVPQMALANVLLENFQTMDKGNVNLKGWFTRDKHNQVDEVYSIDAEGENKYLHAHSTGQFVQIFKRTRWDSKKHPFLSWKWKVLAHPEGAHPEKGPDDNAAAVYVVFKKSLFSVRTIKYVWAPDGEVEYIRKKDSDYPQIIIRVGEENPDKWVIEKRNVFEDYKRLFGKAPKDAIAFGIVTESDSVKVKNAMAQYDDFYALSE